MVDELSSFGFYVTVLTKHKNIQSNIESAFIKATTKKQVIVIEAESEMIAYVIYVIAS